MLWLFVLRKRRGTMADLIDRDKAIEILKKIQAQHARRTCQRSSLQQAAAIGYAIEILRKLPKEQ
jgi:hypothetical protein